MPMGIITDEELQDELKRNGNSGFTTEDNIKKEHGRNKGDINVPDGIRKLIGEDAITQGRESAIRLGESLGISASSVSAYTNGSTSTTSYNQRNPELNKANNDVKEKIRKSARVKLIAALKHITPEKLENAKLQVISGVARDMSAIIKNMEPKESGGDVDKSTKVQVVLYSPQRKTEKEFETFEVRE
jgi:hypothetical protein